ncbi:MAG: DinB family protein, partial [Anaerolineae bacterium]|nr:DinB family protein [Anaerolineae bacterium]
APLNTDTAAQLGVPVTQGTHILGVADGMGAAAAGLQTDDVLIRLDGKPVVDFPSMQAALAGHHGGDVVKIEFYRGQELHTADMQLSKRSAPDVPETPAALADSVRETYAQLADELAAVLEGVPEAVLAQKPAEQEWSVCENLSHLIWTERWVHIWMHGAAGGENQVPWPDNGPIHLAGTLAAYPTSADLVAELDRSKAATVGMIEVLPATFAAHHKFAYQQLAQLVTGNFAHDRQHHAQIHDAIEAVKASV